MYGGGGAGVSDIGGGLQVTNLSREGFWIKITSGTNPYAWTAVYESSPGTWADWSGLTGTTTVNPAYELNGNTTVAANTRVRAEIGTDGTSLVFDASSSTGGGGSGSFSGARVYRTTNQTLNDATDTAIQFGSERFDQNGTYHDNVTNNTRLTAPTTGYYMIGANIEWDTQTVTARVSLRVNGTTVIAATQNHSISSDETELRQVVTTLYQLNASDYVECMAYQASGGSQDVVASGNYSPEFWITRIGQ